MFWDSLIFAQFFVQWGGEVIFLFKKDFFIFFLFLLQKLLLNTKHGLNGKKKTAQKPFSQATDEGQSPHIVPFEKFHRTGGASLETFQNVKYDATEKVGGDQKMF